MSVPLSMPAILLQNQSKQATGSNSIPVRDRESRESRSSREPVLVGGRRRINRIHNNLFSGNQFIMKPTSKDYDPRPPSSFLPKYAPPLPSVYVPSADPNTNSPLSTANGQFYLSLKGIRKNLIRLTGSTRGAGGRTEELLGIIEGEILNWLEFPTRNHRTYGSRAIDSTPVLNPNQTSSFDLPDLPSSSSTSNSKNNTTPEILEYIHTPSHLLWSMPDSFTRYLTHIIARYYNLPSFSTQASKLPPSHLAHSLDNNVRVTHFLRPNFIRVDLFGTGTRGESGGNLDTPANTDLSGSGTEGGRTGGTISSATETDSEGSIRGSSSSRGGGGGGESDWEEDVREWIDVERLQLGEDDENGDSGIEGDLYEVGSNYERDEETTDDDESIGGESGGGSLESSLSELPPRLISPNTPNSNSTSASNLEDVLLRDIREGSATPRVVPRTSFGGRRSGRRSSGVANGNGGGGYGGESSPSRSPDRVDVRREAVREQRQEWNYPEKSFLDYLFNSTSTSS